MKMEVVVQADEVGLFQLLVLPDVTYCLNIYDTDSQALMSTLSGIHHIFWKVFFYPF
jgi:hypothetical protein